MLRDALSLGGLTSGENLPMSEPVKSLVHFELREDLHVGTIQSSKVVNPINIGVFSNEVTTYVQKHPKLVLILNFEHVDYLSSSVISELLRIRKVVEQVSGELRLCGISDMIQEVFEITNLTSMFTIHKDGVDADIRRYKRMKEIQAQESAWKE